MSLPAETPAPDQGVITQALEDATVGDPSLNAPLQLFNSEYDANNGSIMTFSPQRAAQSSLGKRDDRPSPNTPSSTSPNSKRQASSPLRSLLNVATSIVSQFTQPTNTNPGVLLPPGIQRGGDGPSPTSVLETLFDTAAPPKPSHNRDGLTGHVPKSKFLRFVREDWFTTNIVYTPSEMKTLLKQSRTNMMYNFSKTFNNDRRGDINGYDLVEEEEGDGPRTRSMAQVDDDWMIDTSAVDVTTNDTRRLQLYPAEQLILCKENTKLLILVKVSDVELFSENATRICESQGTGEIVISGERYYCLRATLEDDRVNWKWTSSL